jgi:aldehyde:ferredoxin oxidoreductase
MGADGMADMHGWCGRLLSVDLSSGKISTEEVDPKLARDYLGGRGWGARLLLDRVDPNCDPLGPGNMLMMLCGPLTGTNAPTGARYMVGAKSPLTGALTCSNSGGFFPAALKKAGWDGIIFTGKSDKPVYLWVNGQTAELRNAEHLWGMTTDRTDAALIAETHPKARTTVIGPAGERGVLFASIMNDRHRAAGRSGVGAVMGSKNLKGVAVLGQESVPIHDPKAFKALRLDLLRKFKEANPDGPPPLRIYGTAITAVGTNNYGVFPTRNFQEGQFEGLEKIDGRALTKLYLKQAKACFACPVACGRGTAVEEGPYQGSGEGPEYETIYAFGSSCGVDDLAAVTKANYLCNELGMDTITMGATIATAMELYEKGLLPEADIGRVLKFGDAEAIVALTELTGRGEGFGNALGEGSLRLATKYGAPALAMVAKGQEFAGYDPRGEQGMGLAYATSPVGASHMRGDPAYIELLGVPKLIDPLEWRGKAEMVKDWQDSFAVIDAAGLCVFFTVRNLVDQDERIRPRGIMELLNAATGAGYDLDELCLVGERIFNAERLWLNRAGFARAQDDLPPRMVSEPMPDGPAKGMVCHLDEMLTEYYELRGWDQDGRLTQAKISELGLN